MRKTLGLLGVLLSHGVTPAFGGKREICRSMLRLEALPKSDPATRWADGLSERELWKRYGKSREQAVRDAIASRYLPLATTVAVNVASKIGSHWEAADLTAEAYVGLLDAIERFDLDRGVTFGTYAALRVRGHLMDSLRALDRVGRRQQRKIYDAITSRFLKEHGRPPDQDELSHLLQIHSSADIDRRLNQWARKQEAKLRRPLSEAERQKRRGKLEAFWQKDIESILRSPPRHERMTSMETSMKSDSGDLNFRDRIPDPHPDRSPEALSQRSDVRALMGRGLSRVERIVVRLYFFNNRSMAAVAKRVNLSESRVSQLISSIRLRMRARLQGRETEFFEN